MRYNQGWRFYHGIIVLLFMLLSMNLAACTESSTTENTPLPVQPQPPSSASSPLKTTISKLHAGASVVIVCIGSSSTSGAGATPGLDYPSQLSSKLSSVFTNSKITVHNKGIGGEPAASAISRFDSDVLDLKPDLVIWQVGTIEAVNKLNQEQFKNTIDSGVNRLITAGKDILLMEPQYYPTQDDIVAYVQAVRDVAARYGIGVVPRYDLIRDELLRGNSAVLSDDQFHLSGTGYGIVADFIVKLLNP